MNKKTKKKLTLTLTKIRYLTDTSLMQINGGKGGSTPNQSEIEACGESL